MFKESKVVCNVLLTLGTISRKIGSFELLLKGPVPSYTEFMVEKVVKTLLTLSL
jgi:hypothetical protein